MLNDLWQWLLPVNCQRSCPLDNHSHLHGFINFWVAILYFYHRSNSRSLSPLPYSRLTQTDKRRRHFVATSIAGKFALDLFGHAVFHPVQGNWVCDPNQCFTFTEFEQDGVAV